VTGRHGFVDTGALEYQSDPTPGSEKRFAQLTDTLGCEQVRLNSFVIPPGEAGPYHRHESQEEVYVLLAGPGRMKIDGELVDVPEGGVVRVPPDLPRKFVNDSGDAEQRWLAFGAPPDDPRDFVMVDE
jgi:quercetin dioxygenase-like cupin family protein